MTFCTLTISDMWIRLYLEFYIIKYQQAYALWWTVCCCFVLFFLWKVDNIDSAKPNKSKTKQNKMYQALHMREKCG